MRLCIRVLVACVAGCRRGGNGAKIKERGSFGIGGGPFPRSSRVRSSRASRARLSPFPPFRTPATQAMFW